MSTFKVVKLVPELDLNDIDLAPALRAKIDRGEKLDFTSIRKVSDAFLDELFKGWSPEQAADAVSGMGAAVEASLAAWSDRAGPPVKPVERRPPVEEPRKPVRPPTDAIFDRPDTGNEHYTPTRLMRRLRESLRGYIESAYPLNDPTLVRARRRLLEEDARGHLLAQEPYIETTPRYPFSPSSYETLGLRPEVGQFLATLARTDSAQSPPKKPRPVLFPTIYEHQARAFREFLVARKDMVVATGTGSGKTECFLIPMLGSLYEEALTSPKTFEQPAVRALILYPMNALVNDQLSRLRLLLGDPAVSAGFQKLRAKGRFPRFGMYTGRTPYPGPAKDERDAERVAPLLEYYLNLRRDQPEIAQSLQQLGRYPAKDLEAFYAKDKAKTKKNKNGKDVDDWSDRLHTGPEDRELLTRQEMVHGAGKDVGHAPDVLVTNYSMLEFMLMRPFERPIFAETRRWLEQEGTQLLLVLDEAHMYRGAKGAEIAFLIRRLRARLGIHHRPEKLRVIATSASLGEGAAAIDAVKRFAADISGKRPADFETITGKRSVPTPASAAPPQITEALARLDIEGLNETHDPRVLREKLASLLPGPGRANATEGEVLAELHAALENQPWVNQLVKESAGRAVAMNTLAERVFPGHPEGRRALDALLTVATLARKDAQEGGLVPTRLHALFRGLHGLYACVNPCCSGRQSDPGKRALLGKLFTKPVANCDACGCRVFEIVSCRSCGSPYILAYAQDAVLTRLSFLWGETANALTPVQLLPNAPRYTERTEIVRLHLRTGYIDTELRFPEAEVREVALWTDPETGRQPTFGRCAMCQPNASAKSRIYNFRTRGEQPFTALIEAQFAEQPPQSNRPDLPNKGRKVLVFSDGRQKAARLAPALEYTHAQDLFRQVLAIAAAELSTTNGLAPMHELYPAVVYLCATRGYNLFPNEKEDDFYHHLDRARGKSLEQTLHMAERGRLRPTKTFAQQLFTALTDRYYSVSALALASVEVAPDMAPEIFADFPDVGLSNEQQQVLFRAWVRQHMERRSFLPDGAERRDLGEGWEQPQGIDARESQHILPDRFDEYIGRILNNDVQRINSVYHWFRTVVRDRPILRSMNDHYYLHESYLCVRLRFKEEWLYCTDCARIHPESLAGICPACMGAVEKADDEYLEARTGYYRRQVELALDDRALEPFGLVTAEHTAALGGKEDGEVYSKVEEYELRFQDIRLRVQDGPRLPPIDVLSCTTTMEVGIDIGSLSGVALRNVPPNVANYQQRAGRAGRRGRSIASVITYAHGTSHDTHYFDHPEQIISGDVRAPVVYVENQEVLARHIHAYLIQRFFHEMVPDKGKSYGLFHALGKVHDFLSGKDACSLSNFESWLDTNSSLLIKELTEWVPSFSFGLNQPITDVASTVNESLARTKRRVREVLPVVEYAEFQQLPSTERKKQGRTLRLDEPLLNPLINNAVLPRYAFPMDVVTFWVPSDAGNKYPVWRQNFDYQPQRDLQLALTEYAPGRSLTIDKLRFESAALFSPYGPVPAELIQRRRPYTSCRDCSWAAMGAEAAALTLCPVCHGDQIDRMAFIRPAGFAPDVNEKRVIDRGQAVVYAGMTDRAKLESQDPPSAWSERYEGRLRQWTGPRRLVMVNKGVRERGFRVCPDCGRSEPEFGPGYTNTSLTQKGKPRPHKHPLEKGVKCAGKAAGPFYLGHDFPTDALLLRLRVDAPMKLGSADGAGYLSAASRMALSSLVEVIALAASRVLQIDEGELSGWWNPLTGGNANEAQLYLYDLLPGGAGYARSVGDELPAVLDAAEKLLSTCDCATSCYRCIRHYGNHWIHNQLDRHLALALLRNLRAATLPTLTKSEIDAALLPLRSLLDLRGISYETNATVAGVRVPLLIHRPKSNICVQVHHPLVDPAALDSPVTVALRSQFLECPSLDTFDLLRDLPRAVARLGLPPTVHG